MTISTDAAMSLVRRKSTNDMHIRMSIEGIKASILSKNFDSASSEVDDLKMLLEEGKDIQGRLDAADISEDQYEEMLEGLA